MKRTPLKRTPFKKKWDGQKPPTIVQGERIHREGASTLRWKAWRRVNREVVRKRSGGKCEWHQGGHCNELVDWHHVFGRGHLIEEPWASFHPLTMMVCRSVHSQADTDTRIRRIMQREALGRFLTTEPFNKLVNWGEIHDRYLTWEPHEILRDIIRQLNKKGVRPDAITDPPAQGRPKTPTSEKK